MSFRRMQGFLRLYVITGALVTLLGTALPSTAAPKKPSSQARKSQILRKKRAAAALAARRKQALVIEALRHRGKPYIWGGASRGGFDCSGFTRYVFKTRRGITLPHSASAQARMGQRVPNGQLKPGDLVFFSTYRRGISHVGIYIGSGKFVHAANRRKGVRVDRLTGYYGKRLKMARRLP